MKRTVIFKDALKNKVVFDAEISNRNGYPEFSASGQYCGSSGQCFDNVKPDGETQAKLIDLWREWHLNGMKAGTERQTEAVKKMIEENKSYDYSKACQMLTSIDRESGGKSFFNYDLLTAEVEKWKDEIRIIDDWFLKASCSAEDIGRAEYYKKTREGYSANLLIAEQSLMSTLLYDIHPDDKTKLYMYGSEWLKKDLPEDFEDTVNNLMDEIEEQEEAKQERKVEKSDADLFEDFDEPETAHALALMLDLSVNEIDEIEHEGDNFWKVQGITYLAGDDDAMNEEWDNELENYIDECILPEVPEIAKSYFDREAWKNDAEMDGRGHALNRWDGGEEETELNGVYYYAYRQ